jgi:hypothetical protein
MYLCTAYTNILTMLGNNNYANWSNNVMGAHHNIINTDYNIISTDYILQFVDKCRYFNDLN